MMSIGRLIPMSISCMCISVEWYNHSSYYLGTFWYNFITWFPYHFQFWSYSQKQFATEETFVSFQIAHHHLSKLQFHVTEMFTCFPNIFVWKATEETFVSFSNFQNYINKFLPEIFLKLVMCPHVIFGQFLSPRPILIIFLNCIVT